MLVTNIFNEYSLTSVKISFVPGSTFLLHNCIHDENSSNFLTVLLLYKLVLVTATRDSQRLFTSLSILMLSFNLPTSPQPKLTYYTENISSIFFFLCPAEKGHCNKKKFFKKKIMR